MASLPPPGTPPGDMLPVRDLSYAEDSDCPAGCVTADEDLIRAVTNRVLTVVRGDTITRESPKLVPVGISARHCHITDEVLSLLHGPGAKLHPYRELRQPGYFAARETVTIAGPRMRAIENLRILGPTRSYTQVELSRTDGFLLGLSLPVRDSGDLDGTPGITLVGPAGSIRLDKGAIRAIRHIHMPPEAAEAWGLKDRQIVRAEFKGEKGVVFSNVLIRIGKGAVVEMHLDTDDGNAADLVSGDMVRILD